MIISKNLLNVLKKNKIKKIRLDVYNRLYLFYTINQIIIKINYLKFLKTKDIKSIKLFSTFNYLFTNNFFLLNNRNNFLLKKNDVSVIYVVTIKFNSTNTRIYLSDVCGKIKNNYSAGTSDLQGKQKIKRFISFVTVLKQFLRETKSLYKLPIILHLENITKNYSIKRIIKLLKNNFTIVSIVSYNSKPHNGCRLKKYKRLK